MKTSLGIGLAVHLFEELAQTKQDRGGTGFDGQNAPVFANRLFAPTQHRLQLHPASVLLQYGGVIRRSRIRSPFRGWF